MRIVNNMTTHDTLCLEITPVEVLALHLASDNILERTGEDADAHIRIAPIEEDNPNTFYYMFISPEGSQILLRFPSSNKVEFHLKSIISRHFLLKAGVSH